MSEIKVLYCFDSKFWRMAAVSMESLLATANESSRITIYCMVAPNTEGREQIETIIKEKDLNKKDYPKKPFKELFPEIKDVFCKT